MRNDEPSRLDQQQILQRAFDESNDRLRVEAATTLEAGDLLVEINHSDDSIKVGDGTDFLSVNSDGSINAVITPSEQLVVRIDEDQPSIPVNLSNIRQSAFDEVLVGSRNAILNQRPTWGVTDLRDLVIINDVVVPVASLTVNNVQEVGGEIRVRSGTTSNGTTMFRTTERGQYQPGSESEVGIGVRIPTSPTGTTDITWGFFDTQNGLGFGMDVSGVYVFRRSGGTTTKTYQSSWNVDKLNGTGPSGLTYNATNGCIYNLIFLWYGYGTLRYFINVINPVTLIQDLIEVHRTTTVGGVSIVDPNLPVTVMMTNGPNPGPDVSCYVGGRQFSIVGTSVERDRRIYTDSKVNYVLPSAINVWHPLIALRKKVNHGTSGRPNSTRVLIDGMDVSADNPTEFKVMYRDVVTGGTYATPTDVPAIETACETVLQTGSLTSSNTGVRVIYDFVVSGRNTVNRTSAQEQVALSAGFVAVLYARRLTTTSTTVSGILRWEEDW